MSVARAGRSTVDEDDRGYFSGYASLLNQMSMLGDTVRMEAYRDAILGNADNFAGKVVLDVGCGTGVLALFAAKAGARKVYAVEATRTAAFARNLVEANGLEGVVTVIQSKVEDLELPERVDIIVSRFMGRFLLRESNLDEVIFARDNFLKTDGAISPSHCKMFLSPVSSSREADRVLDDYRQSLEGFEGLRRHYSKKLALDIGILSRSMWRETKELTLGLSFRTRVDAANLASPPALVKELDLLLATLEDVKGVDHDFELKVEGGFNLWAGWFSIQFRGSPANPSANRVGYDSGPQMGGAWGTQEGFIVHPPVLSSGAFKIEGHLKMTRKPHNRRFCHVEIAHRILPLGESSKDGAKANSKDDTADSFFDQGNSEGDEEEDAPGNFMGCWDQRVLGRYHMVDQKQYNRYNGLERRE